MEKAIQGMPVETFPVPDGIVFIKVDQRSGAPVTQSSRSGIYECFLEGTTPGNAVPVEVNDLPDDVTKNATDGH
jgi:membrane carboxypeptidase/penicillin-binding protein